MWSWCKGANAAPPALYVGVQARLSPAAAATPPPPNAYPQGAVTHNGHAQSEFCVARASAYVDQIDAHLPALTVRETLNFAESCLGPSPIAEGLVVAMLNWEKEQEVEHSEEDAQVCCALSMLEMLCCAAAASQTPHAASFEYGTVC